MSFKISRRNVLVGGFALLAGCGRKTETVKPELPTCPAMSQDQLEQNGVFQGGPGIGGSLNGLMHDEKLFLDKPDGSYRLIYFGTGHSIPGCDNDLGTMHDALDQASLSCNDVRGKIVPYFIYPDLDESYGTKDNVSKFVDAPGSSFIGLHGDLAQVKQIAQSYAAMYVEQDDRVVGHTRNIYLMGPDGKNLAYFKMGASSYIISQQIIRSMGKGGQLFQLEDELSL